MIGTNHKCCPSYEEWRRVEKMCEFLETLYEASNPIFSSSYSTSNLYFILVWKISCMLQEKQFNDEGVINDTFMRIAGKFDK